MRRGLNGFCAVAPSAQLGRRHRLPSLCCLASPRAVVSRDGSSLSPAYHLLESVAEKANVSQDQVEKLHELGRIVLLANKTTNLTAVRTEDGIIARHLVDGLGLLPLLDIENPRTILDMGSGAGFPGLILAICRPWTLTLVESSGKKSKFHEQAIADLGLANVRTEWARAEELGQDIIHRESYDVCVARAVAQMPVLAELTLPLIRVGGALIAQKSVERSGQRPELQVAANALKKVGGSIENVEFSWTAEMVNSILPTESDSDDEDRQRAFVTVRKVKPSDSRYPRLSGTPKKNPL